MSNRNSTHHNSHTKKDPRTRVKSLLISSTIKFIEKRCEELKIPETTLKPAPNCCQSLVTLLDLAMLCSKTEALKQEKPDIFSIAYNDNICSSAKNLKTLDNLESELVVSSCVMLVEYLLTHKQKRNLKFEVGFPPAPLSLISSPSTLGNYEFKGNGPCALTLSMYFIKTCGRACNVNRPIVAGVSSIPVACMSQCSQYSKDFCMVGCKRYGCSVEYYDCMNLLCGTSP
ncbi:hypothetical protein cmbei_2003040 [Cryptosporidium meleagridis]